MARQAEPWRRGETGSWYAWVDKKQKRLAGPEATKAEAWVELHRLVAAKAKEERRRPEALRVGDVLRFWLDARIDTIGDDKGTKDAVRREGRRIASAIAAFGQIPADSIRPIDVEGWMNRPEWNPTTRNAAASAVKRAFRWAKRVGHLEANPLAELRCPSPLRRELVMSEVEYAQFVGAIPDESLRDIVRALRETGARPKELRTLTVDRVDFGAGRSTVINKTRKSVGEKTRLVYLSDGAVEILRRRIGGRTEGNVFLNSKGRAWTETHLAHRFEAVRAKVGLGEECCAYALRHMFATDALERGVPPATVAELMGHKDLNMIMRIYNKLKHRTDHLREAVKQIRPGG